jgi:hypothetical protein
MAEYAVFYASAGCLPDSDEVPTFDSLAEAVEYVKGEYYEVVDSSGMADHAFAVSRKYVLDGMGCDDPRPNSLYRWSIEPVERVA